MYGDSGGILSDTVSGIAMVDLLARKPGATDPSGMYIDNSRLELLVEISVRRPAVGKCILTCTWTDKKPLKSTGILIKQ